MDIFLLSKPIYHQRVVYTRFKKCHGLKLQSLLVPDGFIACLFSPVPVKTHDARLLQENGLLDQLEGHSCPMRVTQQFVHYMVT